MTAPDAITEEIRRLNARGARLRRSRGRNLPPFCARVVGTDARGRRTDIVGNIRELVVLLESLDVE